LSFDFLFLNYIFQYKSATQRKHHSSTKARLIKIITEAMNDQRPKAILLTNGMLHMSDAKTAHGLIRGTERFTIVAVIDNVHAGKMQAKYLMASIETFLCSQLLMMR